MMTSKSAGISHVGRLIAFFESRIDTAHESRQRAALKLLLVTVSVVSMVMAAFVHLSLSGQTVVCLVGIALYFIINRRPGPRATLSLKGLSVIVSLRYMIWRLTETLNFSTWVQTLLGSVLVLAELYAFMMLILSYFQSLHPLRRRIEAMPADIRSWPNVDIYIPTYNEELRIVRKTVLAAIGIDWPHDRINVYLLDDGNREEFREFAESCGVGYIARAEHEHAKAGNLNHALRLTSGELVAIFDCDHVAKRSFLQETVGWFIKDPRLALLQTPHHFYSPDPFQRNFSRGSVVPPEGNLFYGLIQDGNDFWNSTFFCGSCAVIRRSALMEVGGIAIETVTEDMHTALKLQRRGWATAYLAQPMAAGLSTERLILHVGQRMRWARGMLQILRLDNPLFGPGLSFAQRLCYFSAIASFLFALPRLVFLTAPMAYLLFNQTLIDASPVAIAVYAIPHLLHSVVTSARVNRNWRYSFWSEVYETTLAPFLAKVTVMTLLFPRRGKFNVTEKGGVLERSYLDWSAIYPNIYIALALLGALAVGLFRLFGVQNDSIVTKALIMNSVWITVSLVIVLAAISIGRESMQIRKSHRVDMTVPVTLCLPDGRMLNYVSENMSFGGCLVNGHAPANVFEGVTDISVLVADINRTYCFPAHIIRVHASGSLAIRWGETTLLQEAQIVRLIYGRLEAWREWADYRPDSLPRSIALIIRSISELFRPATFKKRKAFVALKPRTVPVSQQKTAVVLRPRPGQMKISGLVLLLVISGAGSVAWSQAASARTSGEAVSVPASVTQTAPDLAEPPMPGEPALHVSPAEPRPAGSTRPEDSAPVRQVPGLPNTPLGFVSSGPDTTRAPVGSSGASPGTSRDELENIHMESWSFTQLGSAETLIMTPWIPIQGLNFGVPPTEVVTAGTLTLFGAMSPDLLPEGSGITIFLNDQYVGVIHPDKSKPQFGPLSIAVNPLFFKEHNILTFHFAGQYTLTCGDQVSGVLWSKILGNSTLTISSAPLPPARDLSVLPAPFFHEAVLTPARIPFVLARSSSAHILEASAVLSSWFGSLIRYRGATFPVMSQPPATGNAVMVGTSVALAPYLEGQPAIGGPVVLESINPNDPFGALLIVTGRTDNEVLAASRSVAFGNDGFPHAARITAPEVRIAPRQPYDAPGFLSRSQPVRIGDLVPLSSLQGYGYVPGTISVPFHTTPDLYTWRDHPLGLRFTVRGPLGTEIDRQRSHVDVSINGLFLKSVSLAPPSPLPDWLRRFWPLSSREQSAHVAIPPYAIYGANTLDFYLEGRPLGRRDCSGMTQDLRMSIDPDSTIDLTNAYHYTQLPNLAYYANSGFPFTRMADLSDTAIVLPPGHSEGTETAFLDLMGMFGAFTQFPVAGASVLFSDAVSDVEERNLIVMDTIASSSSLVRFLRDTPYTFKGRSLVYSSSGLIEPFHLMERQIANGLNGSDKSRLESLQTTTSLEDGGILIERRSPFSRNATMVLMLSENPQGLERLVQAMHDPKIQPMIQGDLSLLNASHVVATRNLPTYSIGSLPFWFWPDLYLGNHPFRVILLAVLGVGLGVLVLFRVLVSHAKIRQKELRRDK